MSDTQSTTAYNLYEKLMENPNKVLNIFNDFFGEERVDMQGFPTPEQFELDLSTEHVKDVYKGFILIHFPKVKVTNEFDRYTIIKHLYIKVPLDTAGIICGSFTVNRSEYTVAELFSNYLHSHVSNIPTSDFSEFQYCCLGTGPLRGTQCELSSSFNEDKWRLFCLELSKYVETESIEGVPYRRLENIAFNSYKVINLTRPKYNDNLFLPKTSMLYHTWNEFLSYYLDNNNLTFSFRKGEYSIGMTFIEYLIKISNSFIEWINERPHLVKIRNTIYAKLLKEFYIIKGELYTSNNTNNETYLNTYRSFINKYVCTFKGNPVKITISDIDNVSSDKNKVTLLDPSVASAFLYSILKTINYRYGRNQQDPSTRPGTVRYKI